MRGVSLVTVGIFIQSRAANKARYPKIDHKNKANQNTNHCKNLFFIFILNLREINIYKNLF